MAELTYRLIFLTPAELSDIIETKLFDLGCTGIEEKTGIERYAYFEERNLEDAIQILKQHEISPTVEKIENKDWDKEWRKHIQPVRISDSFTVTPSWLSDSVEPAGRIIIDPKMTFGSGHHETTRLCASFLEKYAANAQSMLDAGTGTAILAIAGEKLGIKKIVAFDNDPETRENTLENISLNNCTNISYFNGTIDNITNGIEFEIITANIISSVLYAMMPSIKKLVADKGKIIFSGILVHEQDEFRKQLENNGFALVDEATDKEWYACVTSPDN